jgi:hypothetical protein
VTNKVHFFSILWLLRDRTKKLRSGLRAYACALCRLHILVPFILGVSRILGSDSRVLHSITRVFQKMSYRLFTVVLLLTIVSCLAIGSQAGAITRPIAQLLRAAIVSSTSTTAPPQPHQKVIAVAPLRTCPTGQLLDNNNICRIVW